ncbi:hypothetical protein GGR53DRAFT_491062 [Hypoxylon sp. FL1150]|nr:hypothetical protein GGR53DRAFT_491062 [Hypoxylon sp. FL1150]
MQGMPNMQQPLDEHSPWVNPRGENSPPLESISFLHPGYPCSTPLLRLTASDDGGTGLHYDVAYYACCIVTGNTWQPNEGYSGHGPYFSKTKRGTRIQIPHDKILRDSQYYFVIKGGSSNTPYPVIPNFCHWPFPVGNIPRPWHLIDRFRDSTPYTTSRLRPKYPCYLTGSFSSMNQCHIIPRAERVWLSGNDIGSLLYRGQTPSLDDDANLVPFDPNTHFQLDACYIVPFPKQFAPAAVTSFTRLDTSSSHSGTTSPRTSRRGTSTSVNEDFAMVDSHDGDSDVNTRRQSQTRSGASYSGFQRVVEHRDWEYKWVMHGLNCHDLAHPNMGWEVVDNINNRLIRPLYWVPAEILLARFAWSLFSDITMPLFTHPGIPWWNVYLRQNVFDKGDVTMKIDQRKTDTLPEARSGRLKTGSLPERKPRNATTTEIKRYEDRLNGLDGTYLDSSEEEELYGDDNSWDVDVDGEGQHNSIDITGSDLSRRNNMTRRESDEIQGTVTPESLQDVDGDINIYDVDEPTHDNDDDHGIGSNEEIKKESTPYSDMATPTSPLTESFSSRSNGSLRSPTSTSGLNGERDKVGVPRTSYQTRVTAHQTSLPPNRQ